jgi:hypothetical protein
MRMSRKGPRDDVAEIDLPEGREVFRRHFERLPSFAECVETAVVNHHGRIGGILRVSKKELAQRARQGRVVATEQTTPRAMLT